MCFCAGQGSFGWHLTTVVSFFLPARRLTQWFPFHTGAKINVTTVTTVKPRVAALCMAADPPTQLAAFTRRAKVRSCPTGWVKRSVGRATVSIANERERGSLTRGIRRGMSLARRLDGADHMVTVRRRSERRIAAATRARATSLDAAKRAFNSKAGNHGDRSAAVVALGASGAVAYRGWGGLPVGPRLVRLACSRRLVTRPTAPVEENEG
jgi:hypothetical protein